MRVCDSGHRKVPVVRITRCPYKAVNFRGNIRAFCRDKQNCPYEAGVRIKRVSVQRGSTVFEGMNGVNRLATKS